MTQHRVTIPQLLRRIERLEDAYERMLENMSDLTSAEQSVTASEAAMEGRVSVDEKALQDAKDTLQKELDAKTAAGDAPAIAFLQGLQAKLDAFSQPPKPAPAPGP